MSLVRLKYLALILGLGILFIMSFLYVKTQAVDLDKHNQLVDHVSQFKRVDAVLNQHILEIRQGLLPFYDPTVSNMFELEQLLTEVAEILRHLSSKMPTALALHTEAISQLLAQKKELLENFKSSNALLRNSLRYLPFATTQTTAHLPSDEQSHTLNRLLNTLLLNILIYNMTSEAGLGLALDISTEELKRDVAQYPSKVKDNLAILLAHVKIVLENKKQADALVQTLVTIPTAQRMDKLLHAYIADHNQIMQSVNNYRLALYVFSVLLLCTIGYILLRLSQTTTTLHQTVTDLNYQKFAMDQHAIISIADRHGMITYANQKFCDITQRTAAELINQNCRLLKCGEHPASFYKKLWETITLGNVWHGQIQSRAKDGSHYAVETTIVPFMNDKGAPYQYIAIQTDITKIKQAKEQLRVQAMALEVAANGIVITDRNGIIQWVNTAFTTQTGYSREEVIGQTPRLLKSDEQGSAFYRDIWQTILAGRVWHGELINRCKDGTLYTEEQTISPVYNEHGKITHFIAIKQDVTERRKTEEALRRSQKMEAIGQLSGGIAHDFNNQLGVIIGYLDFLRNHFTVDEKPRQWVDIATKATLRCMDLTRQLLTFSRSQTKETTVLDINTTLKDLETMIARSVTPEVMVQYFLTDNLWRTEANPGEFQDAVLNLVINARDAMPSGGKLRIKTTNKHLDNDYVAVSPGLEPGDYVQLMLRDTGCGMSKETLEHIFEPFFTTKPEGKGTGLGMAMVYGFVKRYGGYIKVYSEPDVGTTVHIYLPRSTASESPAVAQNNHGATLPTGSESILIVDDEINLLQLADQYLSDLGYRTCLAENAAQALEIIAGDEKFDLLFSDVVMPGGMNGYELAQQATKQRPDLKVLLTSGFTSKSVAHNGLARFTAHLLSKPYRQDDLAQRIRLVLDEPAFR